MQNYILISLIVVSILLIVSILFQQMGSSAGITFGGSSGGYHVKRGLEGIVFKVSIALSVLLVILSIVYIVL